MTNTWTRRAALAAAVLASGRVLAGAPPERLASRWASPPVSIDGLVSDWAALAALEEAKLAVGVANDGQHLYLAISSTDQTRRRQLLATGLVVWLDPGGGKKRTFGVRFPGVLGPDFRRLGDRPATRSAPDDASGTAKSPLDRIEVPPLTYFELLGPKDDDRRRLERSAVTAIQVAREMREGTLVFELQVPLAKESDTTFGVGTRPGESIGLGLETPKIERPDTPGPRGTGGRRLGGIGGMSGGMGGGGMGGRSGPDGERMEKPSTIKLWTTVRLAGASS